jgi:uncharacterized BrkB/YihY/UPF0761 family membrane protein
VRQVRRTAPASSLITLLLWIYYSALILLFGAEFTQVYANMYGSQIEPHSAMISIANGGGFYPARNIVGRDFLHLGPEAKHNRIFQS